MRLQKLKLSFVAILKWLEQQWIEGAEIQKRIDQQKEKYQTQFYHYR